MKEVITNTEELKEAGNQYAKISREIEQAEIEMNKEIDKIKSRILRMPQ
ncbi:MAG: hypothetical protein ACRCWI_02290 [Brevinema sp.]